MPCTDCTGLLRMETPCTDTNDATCVCDYGYFMLRLTGQCQACTACPVGRGVLRRCAREQDTTCETCTDDTYSDQESELNLCLPCTICEDTEELQHCTATSDTVCQGTKSVSVVRGVEMGHSDFAKSSCYHFEVQCFSNLQTITILFIKQQLFICYISCT